MDILKIINILKDKFSKIRFFVRVYHIQNDIFIYNDKDIILKYNIDLFKNIDYMIKLIMNDIRRKIEYKYSVPNELVSVIIPNYNNEIFLKNVITKILENTYNNIEIIIVDDKSTDKSVDIINSFQNNKIKLYENKENSGTYYSRNKGILLSKGCYILIVDGDDYIDSTYIENMVNGLKNNNNVWGYAKKFERVYLSQNFKILNKKKVEFHNILFKRKLFNYLGFFHNSRFGADSEYIYRARIHNFPIFYNNDNNNIQYHANSIKDKNLTQLIKWDKRKEYLNQSKKTVNLRNYIEMAFLD
jgi:glycosyltransferase involved in cell wall biosynthesis